jgi:hypothetical protein
VLPNWELGRGWYYNADPDAGNRRAALAAGGITHGTPRTRRQEQESGQRAVQATALHLSFEAVVGFVLPNMHAAPGQISRTGMGENQPT